jgi:3-deoxy-D-manno-octulosonate 8-phosphate phosphatase (KDO 8-P phosphatase)
MSLEDRARRIRLVLFDVDGVLTDGVVVMHADGSESKGFHIKDGAAIVWAQRAGVQVGLLSARSSGATTHRAAQLAVRIVQQGVSSKASAFDTILKSSGAHGGSGVLTWAMTCSIFPVLERVGLSAAPA